MATSKNKVAAVLAGREQKQACFSFLLGWIRPIYQDRGPQPRSPTASKCSQNKLPIFQMRGIEVGDVDFEI